MFHAERPRHRLEAGTTWNIAHRIMCFRHTGFDHSSVLLYLMLSIINRHAHSWINWFFIWALCKYFAVLWTAKSITVFTKYCHWTIFWTIWITSAHARFFFNIFVDLFINIKQLDALNCIISLFQASTCFEHMYSSSGGQNCIILSLVSSHKTILPSLRWVHVLEARRSFKYTYYKSQCIKLVDFKK